MISAFLAKYALMLMGAALAVSLALLGVQTMRRHSLEVQLAAEKLARQTDSTLAAQATTDAVNAARTEEHRRAEAQTEIARGAAAELAGARADAAAAGRAAVGLRQRAAALAAACGGGGEHSAVAAAGPAASSPGDLLADVLGRLDAAGRELAAVADERGIAGRACEGSYDALRGRVDSGR